MEVDFNDLLISSPFTMLCAGSTSSGKTHFVKTFIENVDDIVSVPPQKILYCYGTYQKIFDLMERQLHVSFMQGIPSLAVLEDLSQHGPTLLILDDLMTEVYNSKDMLNLFTQYSHHNNISVIFTSQNVYYGGKFGRTITLNCHYLVLFKNYNLAQVRFLGQQLFPGQSAKFLKIYQDAISVRFGYLFINIHPAANTDYMLRSQIFPGNIMYVYK